MDLCGKVFLPEHVAPKSLGGLCWVPPILPTLHIEGTFIVRYLPLRIFTAVAVLACAKSKIGRVPVRIILGHKLVPEHYFVHVLFLFRTSFAQRWFRRLANPPRTSKHLRVITCPPNLPMLFAR